MSYILSSLVRLVRSINIELFSYYYYYLISVSRKYIFQIDKTYHIPINGVNTFPFSTMKYTFIPIVFYIIYKAILLD